MSIYNVMLMNKLTTIKEGSTDQGETVEISFLKIWTKFIDHWKQISPQVNLAREDLDVVSDKIG